MLTFDEIKNKIKETDEPERYGGFLTMLERNEQNSTNPKWDITYFSNNTEFCINSAKMNLNKMRELSENFKLMLQGNTDECSFSFDELRRELGSFCVFLSAALDSFAHETNILYGCGKNRRDVELLKILKCSKLDGKALGEHLSSVKPGNDLDFDFLRGYRNAVAHGYVFPVNGSKDGLFLAKNPRGEMVEKKLCELELVSFFERIFDKIDIFIKEGWMCFSKDELSPDA